MEASVSFWYEIFLLPERPILIRITIDKYVDNEAVKNIDIDKYIDDDFGVYKHIENDINW